MQVILDALQAASRHPRSNRAGTAIEEIESSTLKQYNETLVRKLETKCLDLESAIVELTLTKARLSALFEGSMDGIVAIDEEQNIVLFNPAAGCIFGCPPAEAMAGV